MCYPNQPHKVNKQSPEKQLEVVYLYFANHTPEDAWTNFIKAKNLEGGNVFHYNLDDEQQRAIETRLGVSSFPTYMLVDTNGEFVNLAAPRPSEQAQLIAEMKRLLDQ